VTTGVLAFSRNSIYAAFWIVLLGQFLVARFGRQQLANPA